MTNRYIVALLRWLVAAALLAAIVFFYRHVLHANQTTVALTMLLLVLFIASQWGLRFGIVVSIWCTACYNFFFLPPVGSFTVSDPQNWVALLAFLITSLYASRVSERIRSESRDARSRQAELDILYRLSRALLQNDELAQLTNSIPAAIADATGSPSVIFFLLDGDRTYYAGSDWPRTISLPELQQLSHRPEISLSTDGSESIIPFRTGVRPRGVLLLRETKLTSATLEALGGLVSISLDRSRAMEDVTRAEAAKESERLRGMMLDSITHELRTPLTSIKASVSTLLASKLAPELEHDLLTVIDEESDRLNRLVAEAVEMAQLDTQEVKMDFSRQSLSVLLDAAIEAESAILGDRELSVKAPDSLPMVNADPIWVMKLLVNLLENAAKYSPPNSPVFIVAEQRGEMVSCSIADRGNGIEPMEQSLIFDKFYRSRNRAANTYGTGMGLAICRAIVEAHGGTITVTSQLGQGSVFTFTLPAA